VVSCTEPRAFQSLFGEIVRSSKLPNVSLDEANSYFRSASTRDYAAALGKLFDRQELRFLVSELSTFLPELNQRVFRETDLRRLSKKAADLGVTLRTDHLFGAKGWTLRGFYLNDRSLFQKPVICLNAAVHPVAVAATFWHEMGHHLTREIFGPWQAHTSLAFSANYLHHLEQPQEVAADLVMVLGCYPRRRAEILFGRSRTSAELDLVASRVRPYVRSVTGFDFSADVSVETNMHILAGMVHAARLRLTLLQEYGV
jgi:hypothetical protein